MYDIYININFLYILVKTIANTHWARHNQKIKEKIKRNELKRPEQILKARKLLDQRRKRNGRKNKRNQRNNRKRY